jgi:hypothetical protein
MLDHPRQEIGRRTATVERSTLVLQRCDEALDDVIELQATRTVCDNRGRHRRPGEVEVSRALRYHELDYPGDDQEPKGAEPRRQSHDEQNRQNDLGEAVQEGDDVRVGKAAGVAEQVQLELCARLADEELNRSNECVTLG